MITHYTVNTNSITPLRMCCVTFKAQIVVYLWYLWITRVQMIVITHLEDFIWGDIYFGIHHIYFPVK